MARKPALTSDELTALAGVHTRLTYIKPFPETTIATAEVNGGMAYPIAQIPTRSESADWTDIKAGMTVIIETTANAADVARFRVRSDVSGTGSISVGEFGTDDTGSVAFLDPIPIEDGHILRVINSRDVFAVFPRIDYAGGTTASIYEDWNRSDIIRNLQPSPIVNISTNNSSGGHYGVKVRDGQTASISSTATVIHWPSSTTVLSYVWTYPAEFTSVSGGTSATLTATAPVGNWEISCTVTPDYGQPITATRYILVCDDTTNLAIPIANIGSDNRNLTARRVSLTLNDTAINAIPNGAGVIMWEQCTWNGTSVPTATTTFVGWLSQVGYSIGGLRSATPEIIGVGEVLNQLSNTSQLFEVANVPTVWQQMGYSLATYNWCIWWILTYRVSGVLDLFNFEPYSTSASVGRLPSFDVSGGTILNQVQTLADRYRKSNVGSASGGEIFVSVPPQMLTTSERVGLIKRGTLTATRFISAPYGRSVRNQVRQVEALAFAWDGIAALPTPMKAVIPQRPAQGREDLTLDNQIVDGQDTLNQISGLYRSWQNKPIKSVTFAVAGNWDVVEPVELTIVPCVLPANLSPTGAEWAFDGIVQNVSKRDMGGGATEMEFTVEPLTTGSTGQTVVLPPPGQNVDPTLPPFDDVFPPDPIIDWGPELTIDPGEKSPLDPQPGADPEYPDIYGSTSDGHVWKTTSSVFSDISPTSDQRTALGTGIQLVQDPWDYKRAFFIGESGILYTNDIGLSGSVIWNAYARYGVPTSGEEEFDFTVSDHGWTPVNFFGCTTTYVPGTGFVATPSGVPGVDNFCVISFTINTTRITAVDATYQCASYDPTSSQVLAVGWNDPDGTQGLSVSASVPAVPTVVTQSCYPDSDITTINIRAQCGGLAGGITQTGTVTLSSIKVHFKDDNPFDDLPPFAADNETLIGAFQGYLNKQDAYCWLSKITESGDDYVYFNRTFDNFTSRQQVRVATYVPSMKYSIAVSPHNWRFVFVTAGDPDGSDAFVYKSADGGGSFVATALGLYEHGGQLWWNWSTSTPNTKNTTNANLLIVRGIDGSDNLLIRRGLAGSDVTIANGAGKYGLQPQSLYQLPRDGDFVTMVLQDNSVRKSSNFATSFSAATAASGTRVYGLWRWPTDPAFAILFGDAELEYTIDTYATYVDMWSDYSTFATGEYGGEGTVIISAWIDLGQHYIRPVTSGNEA